MFVSEESVGHAAQKTDPRIGELLKDLEGVKFDDPLQAAVVREARRSRPVFCGLTSCLSCYTVAVLGMHGWVGGSRCPRERVGNLLVGAREWLGVPGRRGGARAGL